MRTETAAGNPFVLMTDPGSVRQMVEKSESLSRLSRLPWPASADRTVARCRGLSTGKRDAPLYTLSFL